MNSPQFDMDDLSNTSSASYANSWISWFLASKGNEYFCEVDEEYIVDRFNLTGLNTEVQGYSAALELITDTAADEDLNEEQRDQLETSARHLYGLIHARFIITSRGLSKMIEKYKKGDFGRCPRVLCYGQALLPLGLSDIPHHKAVKLYCPRCEDLYSPKSTRHGMIDGAYFGSTFAHMLFMVYPGLIPSKSIPGAAQPSGAGGGGTSQVGSAQGGLQSGAASKVERVRPRIFGFKVHEAAKLQRWQERQRDKQIVRLEQIERQGQMD
ncbi:casein kinase 2 regulatory subunit [Microbotryomycetes sp. JL201]|nr:casein kinase 2 regulatory subunit [Microbotryomycetes sp. JL201]